MTTPSAHQADGGEREALKCCLCGCALTGLFIGMGDGDGRRFGCGHCYWMTKARRLEAARDAAVEAKEKAERELAMWKLADGDEHRARLAEVERDAALSALAAAREALRAVAYGHIPERLLSLGYAATFSYAQDIARAALDAGEGKK